MERVTTYSIYIGTPASYDVGNQHFGVLLSILYTPGQMMGALALSKQQWRTYRQALPALNAESGHTACFSVGDLLATAVVQSAINTLRAPVSSFSSSAAALYEVCNAYAWIRLERANLALIVGEGRVVLLDADQRPPLCTLAVIVHLHPLISNLRERLLAQGTSPQGELAFPPRIAGGQS